MEPIEATTNPFGGVIPNPKALEDDPASFARQLEASLNAWAKERFKVVWLEVPITKADLVPVAAKAGFVFHHAREDYVMMTLQLVENSHIPPYASHYIGAGGVVINESNEILVVSERHRRSRGPAFKLPGGALHPGEHLADGVIREVLEETGVRTRFESLVCFRHWHGYRYDKSDIYFVCRLSPLSNEITMQVEEIADCLWMPVNDYLGDEGVSPFNKRIVRAALNSPGVRPAAVEGYDDESRYEFFMPHENI
jgi:8-oxo-dGTP pyrophosphatase MutT (NUDIX family)